MINKSHIPYARMKNLHQSIIHLEDSWTEMKRSRDSKRHSLSAGKHSFLGTMGT